MVDGAAGIKYCTRKILSVNLHPYVKAFRVEFTAVLLRFALAFCNWQLRARADCRMILHAWYVIFVTSGSSNLRYQYHFLTSPSGFIIYRHNKIKHTCGRREACRPIQMHRDSILEILSGISITASRQIKKNIYLYLSREIRLQCIACIAILCQA